MKQPMKIVKEHILFEKFVEDGDPIKQMGIGIFTERDFKSEDELYDFLAENILGILERNELSSGFILTNSSYCHAVIKTVNKNKIENYIDKYVSINGKKVSGREEFSIFKLAKRLKTGVRISTKQELDNSTPYLTEKFSEDSDPIKDMGIGRYERYRPQCIDILRRFLRYYSNSELFQLKKKLLQGGELTLNDLKKIKEWGSFLIAQKKMHRSLNLPNINEKFSEDSDPIYDMGIGNKFVYLKEKDFIRSKKPYEYDLAHNKFKNSTAETFAFVIKITENEELLTIEYIPFPITGISKSGIIRLKNGDTSGLQSTERTASYENWDEYWDVIKLEDVLKESLNEKFSEDSDPVVDMGIGTKQAIINAAKKMIQLNKNEAGEIIILNVEMWSLGIIFHTNNPNWQISKISEYLKDIMKQSELSYFCSKKLNHLKPVVPNKNFRIFSVLFKPEYKNLFNVEGTTLENK